MYHLDHEKENITNFNIAQAVIELCDDTHPTCNELNAEVVAKMILLQIDAMKEGAKNDL
jgi:hypothetical protein